MTVFSVFLFLSWNRRVCACDVCKGLMLAEMGRNLTVAARLAGS